MAIDSLRAMGKDRGYDLIVGPGSRGFIFGVPVAYAEHKGFVPVRKKGKLPCETVSVEYALEYGTAEIEIHKDAIRPGQKVVIIDDLIATGGTTKAMTSLIEKLGGQVVKICFVMELAGLKGRELLDGYAVESAIIYEGKYRISGNKGGRQRKNEASVLFPLFRAGLQGGLQGGNRHPLAIYVKKNYNES